MSVIILSQYMVYFTCSHVDAFTVDNYTSNIDKEDLEDENESCLSLTMEFFHMLENDSPLLRGITDEPRKIARVCLFLGADVGRFTVCS